AQPVPDGVGPVSVHPDVLRRVRAMARRHGALAAAARPRRRVRAVLLAAARARTAPLARRRRAATDGRTGPADSPTEPWYRGRGHSSRRRRARGGRARAGPVAHA